MKGQYTGFYKYSERIQKNLPREQTFFEINITEVNEPIFYGTVQDEPGGPPGTGTITGELVEDKIFFIKQMAIASSIALDGQQRTYNTRHPKIYYQGIKTGEIFTGTWKIKFGFIFVGLIPIPIIPTSGTWEMREK
jgi:hypothetical protein